MALVIYWYNSICFGIVGITFLASLWVLWRKEFLADTRKHGNTEYESLIVSTPDTDGYVQDMPRNHVGSFQLWRSCWKGVRPEWLMVTRLVSFLIMASLFTWDMVEWGATILMYYTGWTFSLVMLYFAIATLMSAYGCLVSPMPTLAEDEQSVEYLRKDGEETETTNSITYRRKQTRGTIKLQSHYEEEALRLRAGFWGYIMQAVYQTCAGAVLLADLSFWCVIVPFGSKEELGLNMLMGCMHTLNAVFLLLDTALNSMPFPWFRLAYFVIWDCIYCVFQWVIHACGFTWWPYPFLELDLSWAPYWYLALVLLHVPFYGIYALIVKAKVYFFSRWFPKAFVRPY